MSSRTHSTVWLGLALGVVCVGVFAWNAPWREVARAIADADLATIALACPFLLMTSVARAWRWRHLLGDVPVSFRHRLTSTLIGFAGNNTLPGRLGEPLRCWILSRLDGRVSFWQAGGSIVVERVFDLAAAIVLLVSFLVLAPAPPDAAGGDAALIARVRDEAVVVGAAAVAVVFGLVVFARRRIAGSGVAARLAALQAGIAGLRSGGSFVLAVVFTGVLWTSMVAFELLMLHAFGFTNLGPSHAIGLLVVLSFAIALPQAPAGVGVVQLASETTLTALYGVPVGPAKAFAIGLWVCQVTVVVGAGVVALWAEGLSLADVRRARGSLDALRESASAR